MRIRLTRTSLLLVAVCGIPLVFAGCFSKQPKEYRPSKEALDLNNRAVQCLAENQLAKALDLVNQAIQADPGFYKAQSNKAAIFSAMDNKAKAVETLQELLSKKPEYAEAYVPLALLFEKMGRKNEAPVYYQKAVELYDIRLAANATDYDAAMDRALALFLLGQTREAGDALDKVLAKDPHNTLATVMKPRFQSGDRNAFMTPLSVPSSPK